MRRSRLTVSLAASSMVLVALAGGMGGGASALTWSEGQSPTTTAPAIDSSTEVLFIRGDGTNGGEPGIFGHQDQAMAMLNDLEHRLAATFVAGGVDRRATETYWLKLTERPPSDVIDSLSREPYDTQVSWGYALNAETLRRATAEAADVLAAERGIRDFVVYPSTHGQSVEAKVRFNPRKDPETTKGRVRAALQASPTARSAQVPIDFVTEPAFEGITSQAAKVVYGGAPISGPCTTGFTADGLSGPGVITAGHCSTSTYEGQSGVLVGTNQAYPSAFGGSQKVDIRFSRTATEYGHTTSKKFYDSSTSLTILTGFANPQLGMNICNYGRANGRHCGGGTPLYVTERDACGIVAGVNVCQLALTNREVTVGGDSGGPWFVGSVGYGIHAAGSGAQSIFTMAGVLPSYGMVPRT